MIMSRMTMNEKLIKRLQLWCGIYMLALAVLFTVISFYDPRIFVRIFSAVDFFVATMLLYPSVKTRLIPFIKQLINNR